MGHPSGVIVRIPLPASLERVRRGWEPMAAVGVPAHVTILFPFLVSTELTPAAREVLVEVARTVRPFDVRFQGIGRFPGVLWLAPEPVEPFRRLTERVIVAFPGHPPYEGEHDEVIPHLTLAVGEDADLDRLERRIGPVDVSARVRAIEVIAEGADDRWRRRWRIALGE